MYGDWFEPVSSLRTLDQASGLHVFRLVQACSTGKGYIHSWGTVVLCLIWECIWPTVDSLKTFRFDQESAGHSYSSDSYAVICIRVLSIFFLFVRSIKCLSRRTLGITN